MGSSIIADRDMGTVFANGREIVSEGTHGKVLGAFPDVCNSPPSPPAGPIPVPYPASSTASALQKGSKRVLIEGKPVGIRDQSHYQTSPLGNEAATKSFGANLVTHQITGKTYFGSWSSDIVAEGKGVLRHLDVTTSNHGSYPGGTPPFPNIAEMQQLALTRVAEGKCPCCGETECAAAFQPGEEPLSMREAHDLVPGRPGYKKAKHEMHDHLREMKKKVCTCKGEVFPSPPCDVFRTPNPERKARIEAEWNAYRETYKKNYLKNHGIELKSSSHFSSLMFGMIPAAELAKMKAASLLPRALRAEDPMAKKYDDILADAKKVERINHLTPKEYGGCPTNDGNLYPQQQLCSTCQEIDQYMTDRW